MVVLRGRNFPRSLPLFLVIGLSAASAQELNGPYLLRVSREITTGTTCVLLNKNGEFHSESSDFHNTRVFEGKLPAAQLDAVRQNLQSLSPISQSDIEEPLIHSPRDWLDIHLLENGKELLFRSSESQRPFASTLKPLLQWMSALPKLPHQEFTEDAGKQNCLPRSKVALKNRGEVALAPPLTRRPVAGRRIAPPPAPPAPVRALLQFELLQRTASNAHQQCALVAEDGLYRFESRLQKTGSKQVDNRIARGRLTVAELNHLQNILDAKAFTSLRHREPPGGAPLNIMGAVLEIHIRRPAGTQEIVLTDARRRSTFFFGGDGDIRLADPLLKFTNETLQSRAAKTSGAREMNGCSELP